MARLRLVPACALAGALLAMLLQQAGAALVVTRSLSQPDAIVMLASHEWERLPAAAAEARRYPAALVLITVPPAITAFNCHRCGERVSWFETEGVARSRIRELPISAPGTYGEALATRTFVASYPVSQLLIVTSPYHTRRALHAFRTVLAGLPIEIGIRPAAPSQATPERWWRTPYDRSYVAYEWAALVYYAVRHGVLPGRF